MNATIAPAARSGDEPRAAARPTSGQPRPCCAGQKRFWLLNQLYPGSPSLHVAVRWGLEGEVATAHLEQAFRLLLMRHEVLRASFVEAGGELLQSIRPQVSFRIPEIDLSGLPPAEAEAEGRRIAELEARASFDLLAAPPFIRATRLRLGESRSILLVTAHHIVMDGWSLGILARELGVICAALQAGRPPALPELPLGFCAHCEAEAADTADLAAEERFWQRALQGLHHFELPTDRLRPPVKKSNGRIASLRLDAALGVKLGELARAEGCTLFMAASAVLLTLLHRYTGETDICIGTQVPGRDAVELEALVGPFVNTLALRNDLSGDPSFTELLRRVGATIADAFDNQRLPLEKVVDIVRPQRDLSRPPLFSVNFVLHRPHVRDARHGRFRLVDLPPLSSGPIYDLSFAMLQLDGGWQLCCEYDADLYEEQTVDGLLHAYEVLLRGAVADPSCRLSRLPVLDARQRAALLSGWNDTAADYPRQLTVVDLFRERAREQPQAAALVVGDTQLSYAELDARSDRVARRLRARGVGRGCLVGLYLPRGVELVAGLLGVLKAGAAYVPIDPSHPPERVGYVVDNAGLGAVLGTTRSMPPGSLRAPLLLLDRDDEADDAPPPEGPAPGDAAYVIYTSGSTGKPKGVRIAHGSLLNLLWFCRRVPGLAAGDRFLALSTVAFDIATLELLLPLSVGARLVLAREEEAANAEALAELMRRHDINVMFATPVTWQLLLLAGWQGKPGLKMLCGGEAMQRQLAESLLRAGGELWNLYGPTETTVLSSALKVESGSGPVPLGPPIANTQFHILDEHGEPVLPGAPGELYIGGDGVGLGYLGLPELTAQRFVPDHIGGRPGARLYRTGDMVRARPGGQLEYLGRADGQIKLRGFRIELGEIESVLLAQPEVQEALTVLGRDAAGNEAIVAYVVPRAGTPAEGALLEHLRAALGRFLPRYMCPSAFVLLPALPRMPNGKVDRRALPPPSAAPAAPRAPAALSEAEQAIAAIWQEVLGLPVTEPDANFFELGGHSLLAAHMLVRIERRFGQRISLSELFHDASVRGLARLLEQDGARQYDFRQVIKLQPNGTRPPLIAINNTGIYGLLAKKLGSDRPFTSLQLFDPALPNQELPQSLAEIAEGYVQLIRRVQPEGPYALLGWCVAGTLAFEIAQQLIASGQRVSHLFMIDTHVPRYFERMPPLRRAVARYAQRLKLILQDWERARRGGSGLRGFLGRRVVVQKLLRRLGRLPAPTEEAAAVPGAVGDERYDQWLLHYLQAAAERYEPRLYSGPLVLFRSAAEPSGGGLDWRMGWGAFARYGVDVVEVDGDHFSMFRDPGVGRMAQCIATMLDAGTR